MHKNISKKKTPKIKASWLPVILWATVIFICSSTPNPPQPIKGDELLMLAITTTEHVIEFSILGFLLFNAYREDSNKTVEKIFTLSILTAFIYAITDEAHQYFVPGRTADIRDLTADYLGAILGTYLGSLFMQTKKIDIINLKWKT